MTELSELFDQPCYGLPREQKRAHLLDLLNALTERHYSACTEYRSILDSYGYRCGSAAQIEDIPMLPVRLFKYHELISVDRSTVIKTLASSGTTGQAPSKIFLDAETSQLQIKALVKIVSSFIGSARLPMLVIDHPGVVKDRRSFSARGAGILGMATFGRNHVYALKDDTMEVDWDAVDTFTRTHQGQPILAFGFTFMVWQHFVQVLAAEGRRLSFSDAILVHSGGWKKLEDLAVSNETFRQEVGNWAGIDRVHNFYGMVEQVGSVFMECGRGHLHAAAFSEVIVRDPLNWRATQFGEEGVLQVLSCLPQSYPGHSLLTEDRGIILGEDDCPCGRQGRYFRVLGRIPKAEVRGCSDTQPARAA